MRINKKSFILIVITIAVISAVIYFKPREIDTEYNGIMYRLGDADYSENIKIKISGYLTKGVFKGDKFRGNIIIGGKERSGLLIEFDDSHRGLLYYLDRYTGESEVYNIISENLEKEITLCVLEKNGHGSSWSEGDGLMISAPADNRKQALEISKRLIGNLANNELK